MAEEFQIVPEKGIVNIGNANRIAAFMERAQKGEALKLAFLGGSITQGSVASTPEKCYAYRTYQWWKETFPKAEFTYINAGIGGTTSHLGTGRVQEDVLQYEPDFVIVEYSVNDDDNSEHFKETYEGLVRRILKAPCKPALLLVHNVRYDDGGNAEEIHRAIGSRYQLPSVSMKSTIYESVQNGLFAKEMITPDDLHPNDDGHALVAKVITYYLGTVKEQVEQGEALSSQSDILTAFPEPVTANGYEAATRYRNDAMTPVVCEGFTLDATPQSCVADCFKKGWTASRVGDKIVFEVEGESIAVQYRKTVRRPAPIATITIDGDKEHAEVLDANFDEEWGDCLYLQTIMNHGTYGKHRVEIEITETHEEDKEVFYLVSLIVA